MTAALARLSESIRNSKLKNPRKAFEYDEYNELLDNVFNKNGLDHSYNERGSIHYLEVILKTGFFKPKIEKMPIGLIKYESFHVGGRGLEIEVYERQHTSKVVNAAREIEMLLQESVLVKEQYLDTY